MLGHPRHLRPPPLAPAAAPEGGNPFVLVGTIVAAKVTTIVVVLAINWSSDTGALVAATTWHWTVVLAALVAVPVAFAVRLRRVRARRADLLRGEWQVGPSAVEPILTPAPAAPSDRPGPPRGR